MFLKFILISICVLWILSKVMKFAFRYLLLFTGQKLQKEMEKQMQYQQQQRETKEHVHQDGTRIIYEEQQTQKTAKRPAKDEGEFTDFEVID